MSWDVDNQDDWPEKRQPEAPRPESAIEFERRFVVPREVFEERMQVVGTDALPTVSAMRICDLYVEPVKPGSPPLRLRVMRIQHRGPTGLLDGTTSLCEATVKTGSDSTERPEHTYSIPREAVEAWETSIPREQRFDINKTRLSWNQAGAKMHVETVFSRRHAGASLDVPGVRNENAHRALQRTLSACWAIAEAEFPTREEKNAYRPPEGWIEVSGIKPFSNYNLARHGWPSIADYPFLAGPDPDTGSPQSNTP